MPEAPEPPADALAFESALARLEQIVTSLEAGDAPLAELVSRYEEGARLVRICQARLGEAELKIELLRQRAGGAALEPFDPEAGAARSGPRG